MRYSVEIYGNTVEYILQKLTPEQFDYWAEAPDEALESHVLGQDQMNPDSNVFLGNKSEMFSPLQRYCLDMVSSKLLIKDDEGNVVVDERVTKLIKDKKVQSNYSEVTVEELNEISDQNHYLEISAKVDNALKCEDNIETELKKKMLGFKKEFPLDKFKFDIVKLPNGTLTINVVDFDGSGLPKNHAEYISTDLSYRLIRIK